MHECSCFSRYGTASSRGRPRGPANAVRSIVLRIAQIDRGSRDTAGLGEDAERLGECDLKLRGAESARDGDDLHIDRKSTRRNSVTTAHLVCCLQLLKKKTH